MLVTSPTRTSGGAGTTTLVRFTSPIDRDRQCRAPEGVVVHQIAHLDRKAQWMLSHPRVRIEEAILDVAAEATDDLAAIAVIGDAVGSRRTTAGRISDALGSR